MKIFSLDQDLVINSLIDTANILLQKDSNVASIYLFGSLAIKKASPGSDADICIFVKTSELRSIDRAMLYIEAFGDLGIGIDLFVYTLEEKQRRLEGGDPFLREILAHAIPLGEDR